MPFEKIVNEFMRPLNQYPVLRTGETVSTALNQIKKSLRRNKLPHLIVVGNDISGAEIIKGFITPSDIVFGVAEHFLKGAEKTGPIFWEGQLETECRFAVQKRVEEVMTPIKVCIRDDEMIMEAIFLLKKYQVDLLPVVHDDEVTGLIHLEDILKQIAQMAIKKIPAGI